MSGGNFGSVPSSLTLDNWQSAEHLHWAFQHIGDFLPVATVFRGGGPVAELDVSTASASAAVAELLFYDVIHGRQTTVGGVMAVTDTDGWIVVHNGTVLLEQYYGGMTASTPHLLMSVTKTLVAAVLAALELDVNRQVADFVPALAESGYAGATVRNLLDMRSGIKFSEDYLDPLAEVRLLEQAIGWAPRTVADVPSTMYDYLVTLRADAEHGGPFRYRSCETDVLGWVCEAAAKQKMPELMSRLVWANLGAAHDATITVDSAGAGLFDGGASACLSDLARFGSLFINDGASLNGTQVIPPSWIADTLAGAADSREAFSAGRNNTRMPGGMYRNQMWFPYRGNDIALCLGIHGQMIYVNRAVNMVAAKLSSWPQPEDDTKLFSTLAAFNAIANSLA
ncbi:serine hydrolase [Mycobacterium sp. 141]|uniref:serine hydrolase domain-containing protein n=1 Tax=Mycobacterium sp. 141 TaxID=1120797 RepID=UPI00036B6E38|nr:serine hydrolase [Mycobacterium sp. 141]